MKRERCETCRFWHPESDELPGDAGECRRYPPSLPQTTTAESAAVGVYGTEGIRLGQWPTTQPQVWCGEWSGRQA